MKQKSQKNKIAINIKKITCNVGQNLQAKLTEALLGNYWNLEDTRPVRLSN